MEMLGRPAEPFCAPFTAINSPDASSHQGQRHDSIAFETVLGMVGARLPAGRPRTRPDWVLADKAYSSKANRDCLAKRGVDAAIPIKEDQATGRRRKGSSAVVRRTSTSSATGIATPWNER